MVSDFDNRRIRIKKRGDAVRMEIKEKEGCMWEDSMGARTSYEAFEVDLSITGNKITGGNCIYRP